MVVGTGLCDDLLSLGTQSWFPSFAAFAYCSSVFILADLIRFTGLELGDDSLVGNFGISIGGELFVAVLTDALGSFRTVLAYLGVDGKIRPPAMGYALGVAL